SGEKRVFLVILFTSFSGSLVSRISGAVHYLPTEVRDEVERISVEVSYRRGKRISDSGFVQYLIKTYSQQAIQELIQGADTGNDE
ncbi:hypothetical protein ODY10_21940, partial [Escherichia coli]|nr:hypothetical protein [Escherichia coli]